MDYALEKFVSKTVAVYNMISTGDGIVVGLSGGADSVCLLVYLCSIREPMNLNLTAVHINHGIRGAEAMRDENFVSELCKKLNVDCRIYHIDIPGIAKKQKISEELAGRNERYRIFNEVAKDTNSSKIAVAHNKNDSVETVLIKLTRGCSLNGLKGISPTNGNIIRPLAETSRASIEQYLAEKNIDYVTDSTNNENVYTRNIIRNLVVPHLEQINPGFVNTIFSNSKNISCDDDFIEQYSSEFYKKSITKENENIVVDMISLDGVHDAVKKRVIMQGYSMLKGNKADLEQKHMDILLNASATGKKYNLGNDIEVRTEYGKLIFYRKIADNITDYETKIEDTDNKIYTAGNVSIKFEIVDNNVKRQKNCTYIDYDLIKNCSLKIRNRRDGDRFIPSGMTGYKKIKKFFIDAKVPIEIRNTTPLLTADGSIVAIIGIRTDNRYLTTEKTKKTLKISFYGGTYE